jgi:hypothetical protein
MQRREVGVQPTVQLGAQRAFHGDRRFFGKRDCAEQLTTLKETVDGGLEERSPREFVKLREQGSTSKKRRSKELSAIQLAARISTPTEVDLAGHRLEVESLLSFS